VLHRAIEKQATSSSESHMEWETIDDKSAWRVLIVRHLSIMSLIEELSDEPPTMGLSLLSDKGFGFYREQVNEIDVNKNSNVSDWPIRCSNSIQLRRCFTLAQKYSNFRK
jgi:hypothetical protein